jgi:hypothetical protein
MDLIRELNRVCQSVLAAAEQAPARSEIPEAAVSALAKLVQHSAQRLLAEAIDLELRHFNAALVRPGAARHADAVVRNGFHPQRLIATGIGAVPVRPRKVRRRNGNAVAFSSALVPRYARRAQQLNGESAGLYLCAIATGDVRHALAAVVGPQAVALPLPVRRQLQDWWFEQCNVWRAGLPPELGAGPQFWSAFAGVHPKAACERRYTKAIEPERRPAGHPSLLAAVERPD